MELLIKGATYRYKKRTCRLTEIKLIDGIAHLHLDYYDEAEVVMKKWAEYAKWVSEFVLVQKPEEQNLPATRVDSQPGGLIEDIKNKLLADIDRVRENKEYIPQAKQACNTTNTLLNLVKLEILMKKGGME